jgi:hypothetical protein
MAVKLFCSYSHKDESRKDRLEKHLAPLKNSNLIKLWHDRKILPGSDWQSEIDRNINAADVILLLISPDFLSSDYCYGYEMKVALERDKKNKAIVIPIILEPCLWEHTLISPLQALPKDGKPISEYKNENQAFKEIAFEIEQHVNQIYELKKDTVDPVTLERKQTQIMFVNRKDELNYITRPSSAPYLFISAPTGYGKTQLLQEVVKSLKYKSLCIYIPLKGKSRVDLTQLASMIIKTQDRTYSGDINAEQVGWKLVQAANKAQKDEVLICIDDIDFFSHESIKQLLNDFIPTLEKKLREDARISINLRIILSGRQSTKWLHTHSDIIIESYNLTPFDYDSVHLTVRNLNLKLQSIATEKFVQKCAKHLMWFTGGHPGAMAKMLNDRDFGIDISLNEQKYYKEIVEPIIYQIRKDQIPLQIRSIFDTLSPIRRFDPNLLLHFIEYGLLTWTASSFELENELFKTHLFGIADSFITNDSTRQLLSILMRKEHPQHFKRSCKEAIRFFRNKLHCLEFRPELYAIDILFLELQLLATVKDREPKKFISLFEEVVQYQKKAPAGKKILSSFEQYLLQDWELDFILSYLFPNYTTKKLIKEFL